MWDTLIFFERTTIDADGMPAIAIAVAENERTATRLDAQGFRRCSYADFQAAWRARDALARTQASPAEPEVTSPATADAANTSSYRGARIYPAA